ncbi:MAG: ribose-phosphate pyrophosphokinase [Synergistales bacterium]|nr:ribose-phosphate pyrophosphokinase [Synergistales bacterium]MDY6402181.1 ribose-phosphate pyrophosphokinase [Synergistales bacterium]MDY6404129.1 ribose-phosphate pyrophosphokinase [Synergistales bacterium]MDY6409749.1 ribose-phosphate pyrophosphokinase [Synergistales bacterium]MDY6414166.1 ribose-phosphate pyrophosphokinase [Synergistales bacterium]
MLSRGNGLKIFSGTAHPEFSQRISKEICVPLSDLKHYRFSDNEIGVSLNESVRGADVYLIQPTCSPANENLMQLLIMADAAKRDSAHYVNAVIPYFGYARQDRKAKPREPITAKLVANILTHGGIDRIITADLHAGQLQGFFDIPVDHLTGMKLLAEYFKKNLAEELNAGKVVVVSPDAGGVARARRFAVMLDVDIAIVDKRRSYDVANVSEVMDIVGNIKDRTAILVDDIIDTAGTICHAAHGLIERGCEKVYACATHAVLSGPAMERINKSKIEKLVFTDTIPIPEEKKSAKILQLSIAPLFAEAIKRVHLEEPISDMFD